VLASDLSPRLREEARCPVCLDFLQDPVSVDCGHSFCRGCVSELCARAEGAQGGVHACPQCRAPFRPAGFRPNPQLGSLVDSVRRLGLGAGPAGARRCARHGEDLSRFCEEDQAALCRVCDTSPEHRSHRTAPLQEAARSHQVRARRCQLLWQGSPGEAPFRQKVEMQRQRFRLEFEKHRGFLALEEQLQLRQLAEEERAALQRLRESKRWLGQHSQALRELAEELEDRCQRPALGRLEVRPELCNLH
uniref:Uncharacterized protein n=1 Tax=Prolemur simus TaxID=1328070 RepID=A0A8C8ZXE6_PROSS